MRYTGDSYAVIQHVLWGTPVTHTWSSSTCYEVRRWLIRGHPVRAMRYTGDSYVVIQYVLWGTPVTYVVIQYVLWGTPVTHTRSSSTCNEVHRWPHAKLKPIAWYLWNDWLGSQCVRLPAAVILKVTAFCTHPHYICLIRMILTICSDNFPTYLYRAGFCVRALLCSVWERNYFK
jgi:hypothetical protein